MVVLACRTGTEVAGFRFLDRRRHKETLLGIQVACEE